MQTPSLWDVQPGDASSPVENLFLRMILWEGHMGRVTSCYFHEEWSSCPTILKCLGGVALSVPLAEIFAHTIYFTKFDKWADTGIFYLEYEGFDLFNITF